MMHDTNMYRISYHYEDGNFASELGFLEKDETPDVTTLLFQKGVWCVQIGFTQPLEHELIRRKGAPPIPPNDRDDADQYPFCATYFPNAAIITYDQAQQYVRHMPGRDNEKAFRHHINEVLQYGVDYAGRPVTSKGAPMTKPEELFYVCIQGCMASALSDNAAVLSRMSERGNGMLWKVTNNFTLQNRL